jgi:hypothetical protein
VTYTGDKRAVAVFTIFDEKLSAIEMLFGFGYRCDLLRLTPEINICEAVRAIWRGSYIRGPSPM